MSFYTIHITPRALNDIDSAVNYYNGEVQGLGCRFADEVDKNFKTIARHSGAFATRYKDVRGKLVQKFPYLILYRTNHETESIEILRLFNTYQNPYWK